MEINMDNLVAEKERLDNMANAADIRAEFEEAKYWRGQAQMLRKIMNGSYPGIFVE